MGMAEVFFNYLKMMHFEIECLESSDRLIKSNDDLEIIACCFNYFRESHVIFRVKTEEELTDNSFMETQYILKMHLEKDVD